MRFRTATLGCKVNQYETELIRTTLLTNGGLEESDSAQVELVVVNTCSVTADSDAKSRKMIASMAKACPNAEIVVAGCFAASDPDAAARLPHVTEVITDKRKLDEFFLRRGMTRLPDGVERFGERHRAYVKVQDGCRVGCAYCTIPRVRPYLWSRPVEPILREIERLIHHGYREIVLTGIHLGHYGLDLDAMNADGFLPRADEGLAPYLAVRERTAPDARHTLARLTRSILNERFDGPRWRIRLGSLEATEVSDELLDAVAESQGRVCPHFHLSMQSGSDAVLRRMRRRQLSDPFIERCLAIRKRFPHAALTTDVIVGFPGESEADFLRTCEVVERLEFAKTHIFRFSPRTQTEAAEMPDRIPDNVKKERGHRLAALAERVRTAYARSLAGLETETLIESVRPGKTPDETIYSGTNEYYLPTEFAAPTGKYDCGDLVKNIW